MSDGEASSHADRKKKSVAASAPEDEPQAKRSSSLATMSELAPTSAKEMGAPAKPSAKAGELSARANGAKGAPARPAASVGAKAAAKPAGLLPKKAGLMGFFKRKTAEGGEAASAGAGGP